MIEECPTRVIRDAGPVCSDRVANLLGDGGQFGPKYAPMENAYAESLIGKLRDECLSGNWFLSLTDAREIIEAWRKDYNSARPHSSLGGLTPQEYAETTTGLQLALVSTAG